MADDRVFNAKKAQRLNDVTRLHTQVGREALARLLALRGDEDVADLGSGTGFYTDIAAGLTTGLVFAVEFQPEMMDDYRAKGVPANVRLVQGDIRQLPLAEESIDVAFSIAVYHEVGGDLGLPRLLRALRYPGRLVIIDWRSDPESWESGPPARLRFDKHEVARSLEEAFETVTVEDVGRYMFAVIASGGAETAECTEATA